MRSVFLSVLALWLLMPPAYAWHRAAHKMTAEIAFELLSEEQQQHAAAVLNAHPRFKEDFAAAMPEEIASGSEKEKNLWLFERASNWPDIARNVSKAVRSQYHRSTWHYINLQVYLTDEDEKELVGTLDANVQMQFDPPLQQNLNMVQALKGNLLVWRDETAAAADRAVAFCWILHLTGDMHQPLHNVALYSRAFFRQGDYGGATIEVRRGDDVTNLHVIWDGLLNGFDDLSPDEMTRDLLSKDVAQNQSIDAWTSQSHRLAMKYAYTGEVKRKLLYQVSNNRNPEISLTAEYIANASQVARTQVIIAGHRIAALITN